jgi:hypothetical protein
MSVTVLPATASGYTDSISTVVKDLSGVTIPGGAEVFMIESRGLPWGSELLPGIEKRQTNQESDTLPVTYVPWKKYYTIDELTKYYNWRAQAHPEMRYPTAPVLKNGEVDPGMRIGPDMNNLYPNYEIKRLTLKYNSGGSRKRKNRRNKNRKSYRRHK